MTRSEQVAQDIVQDVFVSLWKNREYLTHVQNYPSYIFSIANNKTLNYLKSKAREMEGLHEMARTYHDHCNDTQEIIDFLESRQTLDKLLEQLPHQKRLIYNEGLNHEQIAQRLNISKNTVKNHMVQTLKFLREHLKHTQGATLILMSIWIKIYG